MSKTAIQPYSRRLREQNILFMFYASASSVQGAYKEGRTSKILNIRKMAINCDI